MADQPEALRLADRLDLWGDQGDLLEAAAELRRLHAENERIGPLAERVLELKAQRDALLEALKEAMGGYTEFSAGDRELLRKCRAVIKAVEESK